MKAKTFETELLANIRATIKSAIKDGTCGMGLDCLKQCTKSPSPGLPGAPLGTNARYYYAQLFQQVCEANRDVKAFLI